MSISHILEDFEQPGFDDEPRISMSELTLEEEKLEAFERGYKAGWEDAAKVEAEDRHRVSADFASNLQELSFTYNEAYGHIARALKPLMRQIVEVVLPEVAQKSLAPRIAEQLGQFAADAGKAAVEVVVAPVNAPAMRAMLETDAGFPVSLVEEPSLGEGQAYLRFGETERQIDHAEVLSGIGRAVDAFFHELDQASEKEASHAG